MKKLLAIALVIAAVTTLSGCQWWPFGGSKAKADSEETAQAK